MMNDETANLNNSYYTMGTRFIPLRLDTKQDVQITVHK